VAQVDHLDEVVETGVAVGATLDEPDVGVDAFDAGVGWPVGDGGDDAVEVVADTSVFVGGLVVGWVYPFAHGWLEASSVCLSRPPVGGGGQLVPTMRSGLQFA
jgi:hypothetical protein